MAKESRVKKSLLNARVNLICYLVALLVEFFTRESLLEYLGTEFIGLTTTLQSLLGFLNLAELGVGTAIAYLLYKPLFDDDKSKINEIISVFGYVYRWIGFIILAAGVTLSGFLPLIFPDSEISFGVIYLGFYAYLTSSLLGYFVNYKQSLLSADQKDYEIKGYYQGTKIVKSILQMILAIYTHNFVLFLTIEIVFGILYSQILTYRINKVYPWLESDVRLGRSLFKKYPEIGKYVKQLFVHKIAGFVQFQITPFLIYSYVSLPIVALYGNYTLITTGVQRLATNILDSTGAGVGNLISEGNEEKIYEIFKELFSIRFFFAGVLSACVFKLANPFITIWLGEEYLLSNLISFLISVQLFLLIARGTIDQFIFGYGMFYDTWAPITEVVIFISASIICGSIWGLPGVLCGPLLSTLIIICMWKPYFLYKKGFKKSIWWYIPLLIENFLPFIFSFFVADFLFNKIFNQAQLGASWWNWLIGGFLFTLFMGLIMFCSYCVCVSGFRTFLRRILRK